MPKRSVKSLHRTGRVSRKRASSVAKVLRDELASGKIQQVSGKNIARKTTASGRSAIAFHIVPQQSKASETSQNTRKAARKAAR